MIKSDSTVQKRTTHKSLDRLAPTRPHINVAEALTPEAPTYIVPVWHDKFLVSQQGLEPKVAFLPTSQLQDIVQNTHLFIFLGKEEGCSYFAIDITKLKQNKDFWQQWGEFQPLIQISLSRISNRQEMTVLAYAKMMVHWHSTQNFCNNCGSKTQSTWAGHVQQCSNNACAKKHFPRTDSAIMALITYQDRVLLVRQPNLKPKHRFTLVTGFVEPGERMEDTVQREALEEVGLTVHNIRYHSSQPWPFPAALMMGFRAEATHPNLQLLDKELEAARWFTRAQLKEALDSNEIYLASGIALSSMLIYEWFKEESKNI